MYVTLTDVQVDDFDRLGRIVAYYQNSGLKVALDRAEATSLERVFSMSPDMLIVDLSSMIEKRPSQRRIHISYRRWSIFATSLERHFCIRISVISVNFGMRGNTEDVTTWGIYLEKHHLNGS